MKNIHVIPTENSSRLHKVLQSTFILKEEPAFAGKLFKSTPQYIYITSDEKIIEGDWFINGNYIDKKAPKFSQRYAMNSNYVFSNPKKISLATDPDLIKDGVQAIDDEFLEWFVKNPKCEEVETYSLGIQNDKTGESGHCKYEIIIPTEEPKQDYKKLSEEFTEILNSIPDDVFLEYTKPKQETIENQPKVVGGSGSLPLNPMILAKYLHDNYEEISKKTNWNTQDNCKVEFENLPIGNKNTMILLAGKIILDFGCNDL